MATSDAKFALPTAASELCIEVPGAAYVVRRLAECPALGDAIQKEDGDLVKFIAGGRVTMRTHGKRLSLIVEASGVLMRTAIEDILAVELSIIHPALPTMLLWHAARYNGRQSPWDPGQSRASGLTDGGRSL
ncbi:hypothetical protein B0E45_04530 [Sinorhizobium sp. A49]|uniref:hypothetical protein n=1 Tax=Sinorhizobium sp. A49 TaxID=1945861 RepID=UPI00098480EE|nr:hypothetical protein [Sinorhizobium sp. A49]OOG75099.1 hypothetical protein B0E45_04530 [Sinorhizobium sp. A49]